MADDMDDSRGRPVATNGEFGTVCVHVRVGATRQPEMFAHHAGGGSENGIRIEAFRRFLAETVELRFVLRPRPGAYLEGTQRAFSRYITICKRGF